MTLLWVESGNNRRSFTAFRMTLLWGGLEKNRRSFTAFRMTLLWGGLGKNRRFPPRRASLHCVQDDTAVGRVREKPQIPATAGELSLRSG
jgi:hypothetical protein